MCGIAGIVGRLSEPNRAALKRMNDALRHRGPDGEGVWESAPDERGWGVLFGHRRLSILDLSTAASQPMVDPTEGDAIVFNGEVYNYVELRQKLLSQGVHCASTGDTEVVFRALGAKGIPAIEDLRGMFALAHWDASERQLLLARDPLGIKPLYIAHNPDRSGDWSVMFASEVRSILASGLLGTPRLNPEAAASVLWNGFMVGPNSAVQGVELLGAGELRRYSGLGNETRRAVYWSLPDHDGDGSMDEDTLADSFQECVRLHMASDVPVGVFLSGGIDSSAVANMAQRVSAEQVHTFTLALEEKEHNEGVFARRVADAIGTRHQELLLTEQRFIGGLESALDSLDQPSFDGLNSYFMSQAVREAGITVALIGSGGDELFGGYKSFRDLPAIMQGASRVKWLPKGLQLAGSHLVASLMEGASGSFPPQTRWSKLPAMVQHSDDLLALYQLAYSLFLPQTQRDLLSRETQSNLIDGLPRDMHERLVRETRRRTPLSAVSVMEQRIFLGERLLRDTDSVSMGASIETRLPLVDHVLLEHVNRLPRDERYLPISKKSMLRRIGLRGLDPALFDRPKSGFVLPYDRWLRNNLGQKIDGTMRDAEAVRRTGLNPEAVGRLWRAFLDGAPGLYWSRIWAIYVFIRWCHQHRIFV
jgi:asparagine synthase (glutamine-hydrolysing)